MTPEEFGRLRRGLIARLVRALVRAFVDLGAWRDPDAARFVALAMPQVIGAQQAVASLTSAYIANQATAALGRPVAPPQIDTAPGYRRRDVSFEDVYSRPFVAVRTSLSREPSRAPTADAAPSRPDEPARTPQPATPRVLDDDADVQAAVEAARSAARGAPRAEPGESVQEAVERARRESRAARQDGQTALERAVETGSNRLAQVAEMDLQQTFSEAARDAMEALAEQPTGWRRVLVGDYSCALCIVASTQLYRIGTLNPIHPGCVPEGAPVRARNISAATRRRYAGKLAVVTTARGDQVSVTPNHPVLTDRGWVPGREVRPGDYLVRSGGRQRIVDHGPDERDVPVLAEQVWRALAVTFGLRRVPLAPEDFHGDGSDSEVDVVRADGYFSTIGDGQRVREGLFVSGHGGRVQLSAARRSASLVPGSGATADRAVSGGGLGSALLGSHLCSAHETGFRTAATRNVGLGEPAFDDGPGDPLLVGDGVLGESAVEVVGPELFDRVANVGRVGFTGHVYNFQCRSGTYEAYNHIVHNCDCTVSPYFGEDEHVIDPETLSAVHQAVFELTGQRDSGARGPDYRELVVAMTQEHGEIGPMLARPRHRFRKKYQLPD